MGNAPLPVSTVKPGLPGIEYVHIFDVAHAALLGWSPNVAASLAMQLDGLTGQACDVGVEDGINAMTYGLTMSYPDLASLVAMDSDILDSVIRLAAKSGDAPTDRSRWENCLAQALELFIAVRDRGVEQVVLDLNRHAVDVVA